MSKPDDARSLAARATSLADELRGLLMVHEITEPTRKQGVPTTDAILERELELGHEHSEEFRTEYRERFYARLEAVIAELESQGITIEQAAGQPSPFTTPFFRKDPNPHNVWDFVYVLHAMAKELRARDARDK